MSKDAQMPPRFSQRRWDASEQIALEIRRYLERSDLKPGDRIGTEQQLAAEFGVSRPTLREALRLLAASHLIRATQGRNGGIFVANTPTEGMGRNVSEGIATMLASQTVSLDELLEARLFMEVPLAGRAARNVSDELVAELEQAIGDAEDAEPGSERFNEADARFHRAIARAAANEVLLTLTSWTLDVLQPSIVARIGPNVRGEEIRAQHRAILDAVRRGRPQSAERAMRAHITHLRDVVRRLDDGSPGAVVRP